MKTTTKAIGGVVLAFSLVGAGFYGVQDFTYSDATDAGRIGVITKLSKKGILCKTWEGEMAMQNFSKSGALGSTNEGTDNTFYFSTDSDVIAGQISESMNNGWTVKLGYEQKLFPLAIPLPGMCQRGTEYEVVNVKPMKDVQTQTPMAPVPENPKF